MASRTWNSANSFRLASLRFSRNLLTIGGNGSMQILGGCIKQSQNHRNNMNQSWCSAEVQAAAFPALQCPKGKHAHVCTDINDQRLLIPQACPKFQLSATSIANNCKAVTKLFLAFPKGCKGCILLTYLFSFVIHQKVKKELNVRMLCRSSMVFWNLVSDVGLCLLWCFQGTDTSRGCKGS